MKKKLALCLAAGLTGTIIGHIVYGLVDKPDGYLYLDKDDKSIYAQLEKDPDLYKKGSRLIFVYKK